MIKQYFENTKNPETKAFKQIQQRSRLEWKNARLLTMYLRLKKIPFVKDYVRQIERRYLAACPYDELSLMRLTAESIGYTLLCSIGSVLLIFLLQRRRLQSSTMRSQFPVQLPDRNCHNKYCLRTAVKMP